MATRILIAAARETPPAAFLRAFPALGEAELREESGWTWTLGSLWHTSPDDLDPSALAAPCLTIWTVDDALWYLQATGPGQEPFGVVHHHYLLEPEGPGGPESDDEDAEPFREVLIELYELVGPDFWPPAAVKELVGKPPRAAVAEFLRIQAEATADALQRLGIPHDRGEVLACLTTLLNQEERDDALGNLPRFLACLGIDIYAGQEHAEEQEARARADAEAEAEEADVDDDVEADDDELDPDSALAIGRAVLAAADGVEPTALERPVELPLKHLNHAWLPVWACDAEADVALRIEVDGEPAIAWPRGPRAKNDESRAWDEEDAAELSVTREPGQLRVGLMWGSVWRRDGWLAALGEALSALPASATLTLAVASTEEPDEDDDEPAVRVGPFVFRGEVADGTWRVTHAHPPISAEALAASHALMGQVDVEGPIEARSAEEALEVLAACEQAVLVMALPELVDPTHLRCDDDKHSVLAVVLRLRHGADWPFDAVEASEAEQLDFVAQLQDLGESLAQRANPQLADAEVVYAGQASRFLRPPPEEEEPGPNPLEQLEDAFDQSRRRFLVEFLGEDPELDEAPPAADDLYADPARVSACLAELGFQDLGALIAERFGDVRLRGFARPGPTWAVHMSSLFGGAYLEYYTDLEDGSSLTTTTNPGTADRPHKQIFRRPHPDADPAALLAHHEAALASLAAERNTTPAPIDETLLGLAKAIDAFLQRDLG